MLSILQREQRLVDFLRQLLPAHHVVPSLLTRGEAAARGVPRSPEVRVLLHSIESGLLRWKLEIANASLAGDAPRRESLLATVRLIDGALHDTSWRTTRAAAGKGAGHASFWEVLLEEAFTAADHQPQILFTQARPVVTSVEAIAAGTSAFALVPDQPLAVGTPIFVLQSDPLITEFPTLRTMEGPVQFHAISDLLLFSEAAAEKESHDAASARRLDTTLAGVRRQKALRPAIQELSLHFPLMPAAELNAARRFLEQRAERASFLLARSDRSISEVSLTHCESTSRRELTLRFLSGSAASLDPFLEVTP
jgi:hypothetical protein